MARDDVALILDEIKEIKKELVYIKEYMIDVDSILTGGEVILLIEAEKEFGDGETIKLEDLKRELE